MDAKQRRAALVARLKETAQPLTGTQLAREFGVSRQVIVGDFAILRAAGIDVYATPQGYLLPVSENAQRLTITLACKHDRDSMEEELAVIVDNGGKVLDVSVEHPLYGEIKANLMLGSRRDIDEFLLQLAKRQAEPLSLVTGGVHLHTVEVPDNETGERIRRELRARNLLLR